MITRYKLFYFICVIPLCYCAETVLNATLVDTTLVPINVSVTHDLTTIELTTEGINTTLTINGTSNDTSPLPPQKPPPALGLSCTNSSECKADNSDCIDNVCSCNKGYISSATHLRCLKVASNLDDECSEDIQCSEGLFKNLGPTTCLNFKCACNIGTTLIDGKCQGPKVLNSNCSSDEECPIRKSLCVDGMCLCHVGYVPNSDDNECLPISVQLQKLSNSLGSDCNEDIQCQTSLGDDAICMIESVGGVCMCKPGTHLVNNNCMSYKNLGDLCSRDEECISQDVNTESTDSRICNNGMCKCVHGWHQDGNVCIGGASQNSLAGSIIALVFLIWITQRK